MLCGMMTAPTMPTNCCMASLSQSWHHGNHRPIRMSPWFGLILMYCKYKCTFISLVNLFREMHLYNTYFQIYMKKYVTTKFFFWQKCSLTMYRNAPAIIVMRVQKKASSFLNPNCSKKRKVNVSAPVIRTPAQIGTLKEGNSQLEELTYTRKEKR